MLVNLMVLTTMNHYDTWLENGFKKDAVRRSRVCNDFKTVVSKISDHKAVILLFDVDVEAMAKHMSEDRMQELEAEFGASHEIYTFSPLD